MEYDPFEEEDPEESPEEKKAEPGYNILLREGQELYEARKYSQARNIFMKMMERWPDHPDVVTLYASAHAGLGDLRTAHRFAQVSAAMSPEEPDHNVFILLSYCSSRFGNYIKALKYAKKAVELCPDDARGFINKSSALTDLGEFRGARIAAGKALELDPSLPQGYLCRGFAYLGENEPGKALEDGKRSFSSNFENSHYPIFYDHALQGAAHFRMNSLTQAKTSLDTALEEFEKMTGFPMDRDVYKKLILVHQGLIHISIERGEKAERPKYDEEMLLRFGDFDELEKETRKAQQLLGRG